MNENRSNRQTQMADFNKALVTTLHFEGEYSSDPADPGGETFRGISRKNHKRWTGWQAIDLAKESNSFPVNLRNNSELCDRVDSFYLENYWQALSCQSVKDRSLATMLFDSAVNLGARTTAKYLQQALNSLTKTQPLLTVDGAVGRNTLRRIDNIYNRGHADRLFEAFYVLRGKRYLYLVGRKPELKKYLGGWLLRLRSLRDI